MLWTNVSLKHRVVTLIHKYRSASPVEKRCEVIRKEPHFLILSLAWTPQSPNHMAVYSKYGTRQFIGNIHLYTSSVLDFRVGNICLCHLTWPSVSRTSVHNIRFWFPPKGNPSLPLESRKSSLPSVSGTSVWAINLGDIRLDLPSQGHLPWSSISGTSDSEASAFLFRLWNILQIKWNAYTSSSITGQLN